MRFGGRTATIIFVVIIHLNIGLSKRIKKRQIYREQVLPHKGGKIPETAFETDRLALNRLQKEGIAIPDGVVLEQRNPRVHPYSNNDLRPVFKVITSSDDRYTPNEGQYLYYMPPSSETTYPIPRISHDALNIVNIPIQTSVYQPVYRPFALPNPYLHNPALSPKYVQTVAPIKNVYKPFKQRPYTHQSVSSPYSKYKVTVNSPIVAHPKLNYYHDDYLTAQFLDDVSLFLDRFANQIPLRR